jgi:hypothetical protein
MVASAGQIRRRQPRWWPRLRRVISAAPTPPMIKPPIAPTFVGTPSCSCCSTTAVIMAAAAPVATGHSHQKLMA